MKILVTGAKGFIGKNLVAELRNRKYTDIFEYDKDSDPSVIETLEVHFRRDERVIRFLTVKLDKFAAAYAEKRRSKKSTKKEDK